MILVETKRRSEVIDITEEVRREVRKSGIESGVALIYTPHTTSGIIINEAETGLMEDIIAALDEIIPKISYKHDIVDNNADAHIKASLVGNSAIVPVENSDLVLGTWQRILFVEFDGPRKRRVFVKVYEG